MKLYTNPVSTTSRPVMMLAAEANIPIELVVVDILKGEHYGEAFTKINPNRLIPVLIDGDFTLTESSAIMKYLADKVQSPLYPTDLKERARVNERMDWLNTQLYSHWGYGLVYPQLFPHHKRPTDEQHQGAIEWGRQKSAAALQLLNDCILGENRFLCGDKMTIADIFGAQLLSIGELIQSDFSKYPNIKRWMDTMKALPSWPQINAVHEGFAKSLAGKAFVTA